MVILGQTYLKMLGTNSIDEAMQTKSIEELQSPRIFDLTSESVILYKKI